MIPGREPGHQLLARKPRTRGDDPAGLMTVIDAQRVNPARAGMIRGGHVTPITHAGKPRTRGDDPALVNCQTCSAS